MAAEILEIGKARRYLKEGSKSFSEVAAHHGFEIEELKLPPDHVYMDLGDLVLISTSGIWDLRSLRRRMSYGYDHIRKNTR